MSILSTKSHMIWETPSPLTGSRVFRLPAWLPDPCYIVNCELNLQAVKLPSGLDAIVMVALDPGGRYSASTGFPNEGGADQASRGSSLFLAAPTAYREWTRLVTAEIGESLKREWAQDSKTPARYSRSGGDLIALDMPWWAGTGGSPVVWPCPRFSYLDPASYGATPMPPAFAWSVGAMGVYPSKWPWPWLGNGTVFYTGNMGANPSYNDDAVGRGVGLIGGSNWGNYFGQRFVAPSAGEISSAMFRVRKLIAEGMVTAQLYSDNAGSPGAPIGTPSWPVRVNYAWDIEEAFPVASGAACQAGIPYWLIFSSVNNCLAANIDTCSTLASLGSGRSNVLAGITNNLPDGDTFLMLISAVMP